MTNTSNHYVNDGHGDWHKYLSIFKKDILTNYLKEGLNGNSFGWLLEELCETIKLGTWRDVGKLMGLIGYGKIDYNTALMFLKSKNNTIFRPECKYLDFIRFYYKKINRKK